MAFLVHLALRSQYFLLVAFCFSLNFQVSAQTYEEKRREFIETFESIGSQVSDAFENENKTSFCALLGDYEKTLKDGWYYLRASDFSYEELQESQRFIFFSYQENCL